MITTTETSKYFKPDGPVTYKALLAELTDFSPQRIEILETACILLTTAFQNGGVFARGLFIPFNEGEEVISSGHNFTKGISFDQLLKSFPQIADDLKLDGVSSPFTYSELEHMSTVTRRSNFESGSIMLQEEHERMKSQADLKQMIANRLHEQIVEGSLPNVPKHGRPIIMTTVANHWDIVDSPSGGENIFRTRGPLGSSSFKALSMVLMAGPQLLEKSIKTSERHASQSHIPVSPVTRGREGTEISLNTLPNACLVTAIQNGPRRRPQ